MKFGKTGKPAVGIAADTAENIAKMKAKVPEHIAIVQDANLVLADPLGIRDKGGNPVGGDVFRTAHIIVDSSGKVLSSEFGKNYRIR